MTDRRQVDRRQTAVPVAEDRRRTERRHGTRAMYLSGCHCTPCSAANSAYAFSQRQGNTRNPMVPAAAAMQHLLLMQSLGIGREHAAKLTGVSSARLWEIRVGRRHLIRTSTEARILAVQRFTLAHGARVEAWKVWREVGLLGREGISHRELARLLKIPRLRWPRTTVRVSSALKVHRVYTDMTDIEAK